MRLVLGFGVESQDINSLQMALRAVVVYIVTVLIVRLGKKRFMGRATAFDVILGTCWAPSSAAASRAMLRSSVPLQPLPSCS